jgi:uncharacterized protein (DUF952 family)
MSSDLIFHAVSKRKWRELNKDGYYVAADADDESSGSVKCAKAANLNDYLNTHFSKRKNLLLLVIDKSRIVHRYKTDSESGMIVVERGINTDAILDKIRLDANADGRFDVDIQEK